MSEDPADRARTYLSTTEKALQLIEAASSPDVLRIVDYVKRYIADTKYFLETGKPTTALASVAYAEGLLDSLTILGLADSKTSTS
jgi:hypothetical protein